MVTVTNRIYVTEGLLQGLSTKNIQNIDLNHCPTYNQYSNQYNRMDGVFHNNPNVVSITNVSNSITNMSSLDGMWQTGAFSNCQNLVNAPDLSDCSNLSNMSFAFYNCVNLVDAPSVPNSITNIEYAYWNCFNLVNGSDISGCNNLTSIRDLYSYCNNLNNVSALPNSIVDLSRVFIGCSNLTNFPPIPNNVVYINETFWRCSNLVNAPAIPNNVLSMSGSFIECINLVNAPAIPDSVTNMYASFRYCPNLQTIPSISNNITNISETFQFCANLVNVPDLSNCSHLNSLTQTFEYCTSLVNAPAIPNSITNMHHTFSGCSSLVNAPDMSNATSVTNMNSTFNGCYSLENISDMSNITNIVDMTSTFAYCYNLTGNIYVGSPIVFDCSNCFLDTTLDKNLYIPFIMRNSVSYVYAYYWIGQNGKIFYTKEDFYNMPKEGWTYYYNLLDEYGFPMSNFEFRYNPNNETYLLNYFDEELGYWLYDIECSYISENNFILSKNAGDTSFTYDSFVRAGYSSTTRAADGVKLFDMSGTTVTFNITPALDTSIYVDGDLISGNSVFLSLTNHTYRLYNSSYPIYYGVITGLQEGVPTTITKDLTNINGYNITINTNVSDCIVKFTYPDGTRNATTVTSTQYISDSIYTESALTIEYTVEKEGYKKYTGTTTLNNSNVSLNVTLEEKLYDEVDLVYPFTEYSDYLTHLVDDYNFEVDDNQEAIVNGESSHGVNDGTSYGYIKFMTPSNGTSIEITGYVDSEQNYDFGGVCVDSAVYTPDWNTINSEAQSPTKNWFFLQSGSNSEATYTKQLTGNTVYYINFVYVKDAGGDTGLDKMVIKEIKFNGNLIAVDLDVSNFNDYTFEDGILTLSKYTGNETDVTVPNI